MPFTLAELVEMRRNLQTTTTVVPHQSLAERFLLPPFSVLDARQGYWQKRKKMWIELGIQSELGRGENLQPMAATDLGPSLNNYRASNNGLLGISQQARSHYRANATPGGSLLEATSLKDGKTQRGDGRGRPLAATFGSGGPGDLAAGFREKETASLSGGLTHGTTIHPYDESSSQVQSGTSIFDPVLCEIAYRWFSPRGGRVLDPFAGGSVRGIVAARLGRAYAGLDLRPEQVEANYAQAEMICPDGDIRWLAGDAANVCDLLPGRYDLLFSCPPYADLERYSDDPRDLSTMTYPQFLKAYRAIIAKSCAMLNEDRFAVWVVGDVRDTATGNYRGFVGDTIEAFRDVGLALYNEAVLVTSVGSLPIRVGKQFVNYRKLGKTHQNVLVFLKGDAGRATTACGQVDTEDLEMPPCRAGAIAMCVQDAADTSAREYLPTGEVSVISLPDMEACLLCDIVRGGCLAGDVAPPRAWVGTDNGWRRVEDGEELTYIVGGKPYLNRQIFPEASVPKYDRPAPKRLRGS